MKILRTHPSFANADDVAQICQPLKSLGIDYFSHVMIDNNDKFSAIGTCPAFVELYFGKSYYNFDIHRSPLQQEQHYIIWDYLIRDPKLDELYEDFKRFSLGHSFTISQQDLNGCKHFYDFSATLGNEQINQSYMCHLESLKRFILYFTEQINANRQLKKAHDIKFTMRQADDVILPAARVNSLSLPVNRFYFSKDIYLTTREVQCLHWLSMGKTFEEISNELSITARTVKAHVGNIKQKLGCKNLFQLGHVYQMWKNTGAVAPLRKAPSTVN